MLGLAIAPAGPRTLLAWRSSASKLSSWRLSFAAAKPRFSSVVVITSSRGMASTSWKSSSRAKGLDGAILGFASVVGLAGCFKLSRTAQSDVVLRRSMASTSSADDDPTAAKRSPFIFKTFRGEEGDGPHDFIEESTGTITTVPGSRPLVMVSWINTPKLVALFKRPNDAAATEAFQNAVKTLWSHRVTVLVNEDAEPDLPPSVTAHKSLVKVLPATEWHKLPVDFSCVFGGDGSLLYAARAFPQGCPPVVAFALGSLGFLCPFQGDQVEQVLQRILVDKKPLPLRIRARIAVTVHRQGQPPLAMTALNEAVIHGAIVNATGSGGSAGPSSALCKLQIFATPNSRAEVTTFQGDGLILASPTGSTAYSSSAGGSMVHPNVAGILVTPLAPFTLSFRPIILPDYTCLKIVVAPDARTGARVSIDGQSSISLAQGDYVLVEYSKFPMPTVTSDEDSWLHSLKSALHWNQSTVVQKPIIAGAQK